MEKFKELESFQEKLIRAIQELSWKKEKELKEEEKKNKLLSIKKNAIEKIEKNLRENNISLEELSEINRDYTRKITEITEDEVVWKIDYIEERIKKDINNLIIKRTEGFQNLIKEVIISIKNEFTFHPQITEKDLDSKLWEDYSNWIEKVQSSECSLSLSIFEKKLIDEIRKKRESLIKNESKAKKEDNNPREENLKEEEKDKEALGRKDSIKNKTKEKIREARSAIKQEKNDEEQKTSSEKIIIGVFLFISLLILKAEWSKIRKRRKK